MKRNVWISLCGLLLLTATCLTGCGNTNGLQEAPKNEKPMEVEMPKLPH